MTFQESAVMISYLQELEKHFFELVAHGNVPDVREFLENNPQFNINAVDFQVRLIVRRFINFIEELNDWVIKCRKAPMYFNSFSTYF